MQVGLLNKKLDLKITSLKQEINMALRDYKYNLTLIKFMKKSFLHI